MKRPVLVLAMLACGLAVSVLRASPGPEPLQFDLPQRGISAASDWSVSWVLLLIVVLAFVATVSAIRAWRGDKTRTSGRSRNVPPVQSLSEDVAPCGKGPDALDAL